MKTKEMQEYRLKHPYEIISKEDDKNYLLLQETF